MRTARSSPRLMSIALAPAVTLRTPSATMAWASRVAVVVPSPTASPVRSAAPAASAPQGSHRDRRIFSRASEWKSRCLRE
jgi:hypothetical protein